MLFRWAILVWWNLLPLSARLARINGSSMIGFQRRKRRRQFVNLLYFLSFRPILARINGSSILGFQRRKRGCQFVNLFYFLSFLLTLILLDIEFIVLNKLSLLTLLYLKLKNKDIILKKMTGIIRMFRGSQGINIGGDQHFFTTSTASFASSPAADTSPASYAATTTQHSVPPKPTKFTKTISAATKVPPLINNGRTRSSATSRLSYRTSPQRLHKTSCEPTLGPTHSHTRLAFTTPSPTPSSRTHQLERSTTVSPSSTHTTSIGSHLATSYVSHSRTTNAFGSST